MRVAGLFLLCALLFVATLASGYAQVAIPSVSKGAFYASEDHDWGVAPTGDIRLPPYHAPTPRSIPGARVIQTLELKALLEQDRNVVIVDVLESQTRTTLPGAYWMHGAGTGRWQANEKVRFSEALEKITGADKSRPLVFVCLSAECWLSYNASLHAVAAGYKDVLWYRGGTAAWTAAGFKRSTPRRLNWQSGDL
jgi:PQQ-dependent catabolism-associated CXXCW motif protein